MKEGISNGLNPTLSIRNGSPEYLRGNYLFDRSKYSDCFIITVDTTKAGSANNTFVLP